MITQKTVIIGLGQTGLSCIRFLARTTQDQLILVDTRDQPPGLKNCQTYYPHLSIHTGELPENILLSADRIVISPGLRLTDPIWEKVKSATIPVMNDIDLFVQVAKAPIIAVTGSNGKGTVITWLKAMCEAANQSAIACGNIGIPVLDALLERDVPDWYLMELSSFQLLSTKALKAHSAIVLNISADHLDYHGTMEAYQAAKHRIYQYCKMPIINRDDRCASPQFLLQKSPVSIGLTPAPTNDDYGLIREAGHVWLAKGTQKILNTQALRVVGEHNWLNALAAIALADSMALLREAILHGLKDFEGLEHRCQWVAEYRGIVIYNDSKGTNVGATNAAICAVSQRLAPSNKVILIMGGQSKSADFSPLNETIQRIVKYIYVFGEDAVLLQTAFRNIVDVTKVACLKEAVEQAMAKANTGDCILLSPACASYDMFSGFAERGEQFTKLVLEQIAK